MSLGIQLLGFHIFLRFVSAVHFCCAKSCVSHVEERTSYSLVALFLLKYAVHLKVAQSHSSVASIGLQSLKDISTTVLN